MDENPLEQPAPENDMERVHTFARDFAYGLANGLWGPRISVSSTLGGETWINLADKKGGFRKYLANKWKGRRPSFDMLVMFGYFRIYEQRNVSQTQYIATDDIFNFLEESSQSYSIFVSYGRMQSSALAVLVKKQLENLGEDFKVFVDDALQVGDVWHARLEKQVREAKYFICLLGQIWTLEQKNFVLKTSLDSPFVREEIQWALNSDSEIYCICHGGYKLPQSKNDLNDEIWQIVSKLNQTQYIHIDDESAKKYDIGMNELLENSGKAIHRLQVVFLLVY